MVPPASTVTTLPSQSNACSTPTGGRPKSPVCPSATLSRLPESSPETLAESPETSPQPAGPLSESPDTPPESPETAPESPESPDTPDTADPLSPESRIDLPADPSPDPVPTRTPRGPRGACRRLCAYWSRHADSASAAIVAASEPVLAPLVARCAAASELVEAIPVASASAWAAGAAWGFGAVVLGGCWLRHPPALSETLPAMASAAAAVVLNTVHPSVLERPSHDSGTSFAALLTVAYVLVFVHFAQVMWWSVVDADDDGCAHRHCCAEATGYYALFLTAAASAMRFGALGPGVVRGETRAELHPCFGTCAPLTAAVCVVSALLAHALAAASPFGAARALLGGIPVAVLVAVELLLECHTRRGSDPAAPSVAWRRFVSATEGVWAVGWPAALWSAGLVSGAQALLLVGGNTATVAAVRILVGLVNGGLVAAASYTGLRTQWMF